METNIIQSTQNKRVKQIVELQNKSAVRRREGLFVVEGRREIERCLRCDYQVESVYWCREIVENGEARTESDYSLQAALSLNTSTELFEVSKAVYEKIAYRDSTEGLVAVVRTKEHTLDSLMLPDNPLIVVLESVEKPGNIGAILRSADASGVSAVIVCDPLTDLYNPNLIRASVGAFFSVPAITCTSEECINFLKNKKIQILTAQLQDSNLYYDVDMRKGTAIVMGTESTGLTEKWRKAADRHIRIPMSGIVDSLNVSVSAAVLMFEGVRQRSLF